MGLGWFSGSLLSAQGLGKLTAARPSSWTARAGVAGVRGRAVMLWGRGGGFNPQAPWILSSSGPAWPPCGPGRRCCWALGLRPPLSPTLGLTEALGPPLVPSGPWAAPPPHGPSGLHMPQHPGHAQRGPSVSEQGAAPQRRGDSLCAPLPPSLLSFLRGEGGGQGWAPKARGLRAGGRGDVGVRPLPCRGVRRRSAHPTWRGWR